MTVTESYNQKKSFLTKLKEFFFAITFREWFKHWWTYAIFLCFIPIVWEFMLFAAIIVLCNYVLWGTLYVLALILIRFCPLFLALAAIAVIIHFL